MTKVEQNACLSTSPAAPRGQKRVADHLLVAAYMLVYVEIAWLIIVILRSALAE